MILQYPIIRMLVLMQMVRILKLTFMELAVLPIILQLVFTQLITVILMYILEL